MNIHDRITNGRREYMSKVKISPTNAYIGKAEEKQLKQWAYDNGYHTTTDVDLSGSNRPEIEGLLVFVVNDDAHLAFS